MLLRLVLCALVLSVAAAGDALLEALAGVRGGNWLLLCGAGGGGCPAALWRQRWAVGRASCLARCYNMSVIRGSYMHSAELCAQGWAPVAMARVVRRREGLTAAPDMTLLALDRPIYGGEPLANYSVARAELLDFQYWMEEIFIEYLKRQDKFHETVEENIITVFDDLYLLFTTILLPAGAFSAFFLYVIFCTGTPIKVPYTNINEPGIITPWMSYSNGDKSVKCYPTYGEV